MPTAETVISEHRLPNGLRIAFEPIANAVTVAIQILLPSGVAREPESQSGVAALLEEMALRGAGNRDPRSLSDEMDRLGIQRSASMSSRYLSVSMLCLGDQAPKAFDLLETIVRQPRLPQDEMEAARSLCLQGIESLQDEPSQRAGLLLSSLHQPTPFDRNPYGSAEVVAALTHDQLLAFHRETQRPDGAVLTIAGAVDPESMLARIEALFGDWTGPAVKEPPVGARRGGVGHESTPSEQTHLMLAFDAPPAVDRVNSLRQSLAVACLSGGASGRLFTEVREKRGLCYSVNASYRAQRDRGMVGIYAGTTPARAQETMDVIVAELDRLRQGVSEDEFRRAIRGRKTGLIMQGESTTARAAAMAADLTVLSRTRTLAERADEIDALRLEHVNQYLTDQPAPSFTVATIGPDALTPPARITDGSSNFDANAEATPCA